MRCTVNVALPLKHVILQHGNILLRKAHLSSYESMCSPDAAPVQDVLHATAHGGVAADLQRIAWAHCQDEIVLTQGSLHAAEGISSRRILLRSANA